ncbi:MAG TPA: metalloregulator ArsR/SmtB family transcription factor [Anaerolineaceae bacterium]
MTDQSNQSELLEFFKALADANRLKIVGILARQSCTVEELASLLDLGESTTSHHLARLAKVGLVSARPDGHYYHYSLQTDTLQAMAQRVLSADALPKIAQEIDADAYDRKVLQNFTDEEGRITAFPAQDKKFQVILRYVAKAFEPGVRYTEKQVNEILLRFNKDTATLRRNLVGYRLMEREGGGGCYWLVDQKTEA